MLLKLRKNARLDDKNKQLLIFSDYDPDLAVNLLAEGEKFWDCTFYFVSDLRKVEWGLKNEMFDYLYAPLEKMAMVDKRLFKFL